MFTLEKIFSNKNQFKKKLFLHSKNYVQIKMNKIDIYTLTMFK